MSIFGKTKPKVGKLEKRLGSLTDYDLRTYGQAAVNAVGRALEHREVSAYDEMVYSCETLLAIAKELQRRGE